MIAAGVLMAVTLRMASIAPDGTAWAREARSFARDVDAETGGSVAVHWYFGGIAGDEAKMVERMRRGQLDGMAASMACTMLAPSLRALRVFGLVRTRAEASYVMGHMRSTIDDELRQAGVVDLGMATFGTVILFSRKPVRTFDELHELRFWVRDDDEIARAEVARIGLKTVAAPYSEAAALYDANAVDAFFTSPTIALAFQWAQRTPYVIELPVAAFPACLVVTQRTFDALSLAQQDALRRSATKVVMLFDQIGQEQDRTLLDEVLPHRGATVTQPSAELRTTLAQVFRDVRAQIGEKLLPKTLLDHVLGLLADYRAEHPTP